MSERNNTNTEQKLIKS